MIKVHSIQSLGTLDGPGVRFVAFLQGCPLRCKCCHNPDTWAMTGGREVSSQDLFKQVLRYKEYFGSDGGITVSGGEPLLQSKDLRELFLLCKEHGINTCLDTSGCILNDDVLSLLEVTDRVLLDIKYTNEDDYLANVGCSMTPVIKLLEKLQERGITTTLRQVIIPTLNDTEGNVLKLKTIRDSYSVVDKVELLAFHKMCQTKYDTLGIEFPLKDVPEPTGEIMSKLKEIL